MPWQCGMGGCGAISCFCELEGKVRPLRNEGAEPEGGTELKIPSPSAL